MSGDEDSIPDWRRAAAQLGGFVEEVKCGDCGTLHPLRETKVWAREVDLGTDYTFHCPSCSPKRDPAGN